MVRYSYRLAGASPIAGETVDTGGARLGLCEIAAILIGGVLLVPIFFSASDFGFGKP